MCKEASSFRFVSPDSVRELTLNCVLACFSKCDRGGGAGGCHNGRFHDGRHRQAQHDQAGGHTGCHRLDFDRSSRKRTHAAPRSHLVWIRLR